MRGIRFQSYELVQHNPCDRFPRDHLIVAEADASGRYVLHVQLKNGFGLTSIDTFDLYAAADLAYGYAEELNYPKAAVWIDIQKQVLEHPHVLNQKLKKELQKNGLYWNL